MTDTAPGLRERLARWLWAFDMVSLAWDEAGPDDREDYLESAAQLLAEIRKTHAVVPRELDDDVVEAGLAAFSQGLGVERIYRAMIAAAEAGE